MCSKKNSESYLMFLCTKILILP